MNEKRIHQNAEPIPAGENKNKIKIMNADEEADYFLEKQFSLKKQSKGANLALIILFTAYIYTMAALVLILPDKTFSEEENRTLAAFPTLTWENLFSGNLVEDVSDYMADSSLSGISMGFKPLRRAVKIQNNDVIIGQDII